MSNPRIRVKALVKSLKKTSPVMKKPKSHSKAQQTKNLEVSKRSERLLIDINQFLDEGHEKWPNMGIIDFNGESNISCVCRPSPNGSCFS